MGFALLNPFYKLPARRLMDFFRILQPASRRFQQDLISAARKQAIDVLTAMVISPLDHMAIFVSIAS